MKKKWIIVSVILVLISILLIEQFGVKSALSSGKSYTVPTTSTKK